MEKIILNVGPPGLVVGPQHPIDMIAKRAKIRLSYTLRGFFLGQNGTSKKSFRKRVE
jgi:hypothetical protein